MLAALVLLPLSLLLSASLADTCVNGLPREDPCVRNVRDVYQAASTGNMTVLFALVAPEVTWNVFGPSTSPTAKAYAGVDGVKQYFKDARSYSQVTEFSFDLSQGTYMAYDEPFARASIVSVAGVESGYLIGTGAKYVSHVVHRWECNGQGAVKAFTAWQVQQVGPTKNSM